MAYEGSNHTLASIVSLHHPVRLSIADKDTYADEACLQHQIRTCAVQAEMVTAW